MINRSQRELEHNPINPRNGCDVRRWRLSARIGCVARPPRAATCRTSSRSASDRQSQGFAQNVMRVLSASAYIGELVSLVHDFEYRPGPFPTWRHLRPHRRMWRPARRTKAVGCPAEAAPVTPRLVRHPSPSPNRPIAGRCQSLPGDLPALGGHNIIYEFIEGALDEPGGAPARTEPSHAREGQRRTKDLVPSRGMRRGVACFCPSAFVNFVARNCDASTSRPRRTSTFRDSRREIAGARRGNSRTIPSP